MRVTLAGTTGASRNRVWAGIVLLLVAFAVAAPGRASDLGLSKRDRDIYDRAFDALDHGRYPDALRLAGEAKAPLAGKVVLWTMMIRREAEVPFRHIVEFLTDNPDWPARSTLIRRAEEAMPDGLPADEVRAWFDAHPPRTPRGSETYAAALRKNGDPDRADALLRRAWIEGNFPSSRDERDFRERHRALIGDAADLARLERLLWRGSLGAARRQARRVDGDHRALAEARIRLAAMEYGVDPAIARVPARLRDHPGLVFERARWRMRKGRYEDTVELLDPPRPESPHAARWWPLRHWAVRRALEAGDISVAYRIAAGHGLESGLGFAQGEWLAGWIALRFLEEPEVARKHFERLHGGVTTPVSRARGAYWAGRAAEAAGEAEAARRWYAAGSRHLTTFYGQLAAARLGEDVVPVAAHRTQPGAAARDAFERRELVRVVRLLAALGERRRVDVFLRHLARGAEDAAEAHLTAELARSVGRPDLAVGAARTARREGLVLLDHLFPMGPLPATHTADGPQALVLAVARQESGFDPQAVSPAGARGLMQLMPATAHQLAHRIGVRYDRGRLTADPAYNMRLGTTYLDRLIDRYDGSLLLAVAAYNAGPTNVNRWLTTYGDPRGGQVDPIDWIESMAFGETRNYVQRVFEALAIYRHRLSPTQVAVALDHDSLLGRATP